MPINDDINVDKALKRVRQQLKEDRSISPSLRASIDALVTLAELMSDRLATSNRNSNTSPPQDPNRARGSRATKKGKPGGRSR